VLSRFFQHLDFIEASFQISHHNHIIALHGFIEDENTFGLVLELASDNLLHKARTATAENFSLRYALTIARQIASAMVWV
jgi:serine/threonine protein kinase